MDLVLLKYWIKKEPGYDYYFQAHVTSTFVKTESIKKCVNQLINSNTTFTARKIVLSLKSAK